MKAGQANRRNGETRYFIRSFRDWEDLSLPEYLRLRVIGAVLAAFPDIGRLRWGGRPAAPVFIRELGTGQDDLPGSACAWPDPGPDAAEAVSFEEGADCLWYPIVTPKQVKAERTWFWEAGKTGKMIYGGKAFYLQRAG